MTDREKLTDEERAALDRFQDQNLDDPWVGSKALHLIDAHEADRAALVKERDEALAQHTELSRLHAHSVGFWEPKLGSMRAEVARLTEALHEVQQAHTNANSNLQLAEKRAEAAEQKLADYNLLESQKNALARRVIEAEEGSEELKQNFGQLTDANAQVTVALNAAEARVRELEADRKELSAVLGRTESELAQLRERVTEATTWLVTVKSGQPSSIIADRARLALEALRGPK